MPRQPNLVIFNPDQWRGDVLGHMGNPGAITPNLDAAARTDFVSFRSAYCQNPICTPSRCSFMTGWYPHVRGHRTLFYMLQPDDPCLLKSLKQGGYHVWWGGKNDLVPVQHGFDAYCDTKFEPTDTIEPTTHQLHRATASPDSPDYYSMYLGRLVPRSTGSTKHGVYYDEDWADVLGAIDFIRSARQSLGDRPFCIYLPLLYPHPPYGVEAEFDRLIDRSLLPPRVMAPGDWSEKPSLLEGVFDRQALGHLSEVQWTELRATYYAMCARVDKQFGMVMSALREAALYEDTAVFFFSDHGDFTGDYGLVEKTANTFEECLTRVPLLIKPPAAAPAAARISGALVELIDVPATIYDYCGIAPGYSHFGRTLRGVIAGQTDEHRDAVFSEGGRRNDEPHAADDQSAVQNSRASPYWPRIDVQRQMPQHTKATMCRTRDYKYVLRLYECDELYDMNSDPHELINLIDQPGMQETRNQFIRRLVRWYQETCDVVPFELDQR